MYYFFVDDVMLPVPPAKMDVRFNNKNKTIDLINEGEVNVIKAQGLTDISFEVMLPNQYYPFAMYENNYLSSFLAKHSKITPSFKKAEYFLSLFERLKASSEPFRLIITRMSPRNEFLFDTNLLVTLEDYSINEDAGNGFDVQVPLTFKQYKYYSTKEVEVNEGEDGKKTATIKDTREVSKKVPRGYQVTKDMTVWEACKRASGGSLDWQSIANLNGILNPDAIEQGTYLDFVDKKLVYKG